ncbi:hypothetical protein D3C76_316480 [compost metagenome]
MGLVCQVSLGHRRTPLGFGLSNQGALMLGLCLHIDQARLGRLDVGHGLHKPCAVIPVVDAKQHVTGSHGLVVLDVHRRDVAGNLCG